MYRILSFLPGYNWTIYYLSWQRHDYRHLETNLIILNENLVSRFDKDTNYASKAGASHGGLGLIITAKTFLAGIHFVVFQAFPNTYLPWYLRQITFCKCLLLKTIECCVPIWELKSIMQNLISVSTPEEQIYCLEDLVLVVMARPIWCAVE